MLLLIVLAALGAAAWWPAPARWVRPPASGRHTPTGPVDAALVLDLAAAALRSGASVPTTLQALGAALGGEPGRALQHAGSMLLLGADWAEAWDGCPAEHAALASALQPAWVDGVDPLPLLRRTAQTQRADRRRSAQEAAARLGVRLVLPLGLCYLPAFVLLGLVPVLVSAGTDLLAP